MRDHVIRFLEQSVTNVTIAKGEVYTLTPTNAAALRLKHFTLSSSQPEDVRVLSGGRIEGVKAGTATVTAKYTAVKSGNSEKEYQVKINVSVIEPSYYYSPLAASILPIRISDESREVLREKLGIVSCRDLLDSAEHMGIDALAEAAAVNGYTVRLWLHQAALFELDGMDADVALLCALAGIRNVSDLSKADPAALKTAFRVSAPSAAVLSPSFRFPEEGVLDAVLSQAKQTIPSSNRRLSLVLEDEPSPDYLLRTAAGTLNETEKLRQGLRFLQNITIALPLPRVIYGRVVLKGRNAQEEDQPLPGCKVSLSGIANPSRDRSEDDQDLYTYTDELGAFNIVMPEKYNLHECVTFTVTYQDSTALAMTLVQGSQRLRTMRFVKRASEIMDAEYVELVHSDSTRTQRGARQILADLDRISLLNEEVARLEEELQQRVLSQRRVEQQRALLEQTRHQYMELVESLKGEIVYHKEEYAAQIAYLEQELERTVNRLAGEILFHLSEQLRWLQVPGNSPDAFRWVTNGVVPSVYIADTSDPEEQRLESIRALSSALQCSEETLRDIIRQHLNLPAQERDEHPREAQEAYDAMRQLVCADHYPNTLWDCEQFRTLKNRAAELNATLAMRREYLSMLTADESVAEEELQRIRDEHMPHCGDCEYDEETDAPEEVRLGRDSRFYHLIQALSTNALEECGLFREKAERYTALLEQLEQQESAFRQTEDAQQRAEEQSLLEAYCMQFLLLDQEGKPITVPLFRDPEGCPVRQYSDELVQRYYNALAERSWLLEIIYCLDVTTNDIARTVRNFLSSGLYAQLKDFAITRDRLALEDPHPRALPSVRLMGEGEDAVYLPTDTAPSRVFYYSMLQRLVEPDISANDRPCTRQELRQAIDVMRFKESLYQSPSTVPTATSLGIGYILNMHQAWVPDGFALGTLLYSLVLAPGEEQRLVIREHDESYTVNDEASAVDTINDRYQNRQTDNENAAFRQAANRYSGAHSDYTYTSTASSSGSGGIRLLFGLGASSSASSVNKGSGSSNASQVDTYDEVSSAAQDFQTEIKTESARLASARRASIRVASSSESESLSSKIVANHNHSHVMTVQYWEVTRRYRMETAIESIDLVLFVPLKLVSFLPSSCDASLGLTGEQIRKYKAYQFPVTNYNDFTQNVFAYRYGPLLRYCDVLLSAVPSRFRGGLNLIRQFSGYPEWTIESYQSRGSTLQIKVTGCFIEADQLSATLRFQDGTAINGDLYDFQYLEPDPSLNTRRDVLYGLKKLRSGTIVSRTQKKIGEDARIDRYSTQRVMDGQSYAVFSFYLPATLSRHDISHITLENNLSDWDWRLSQETAYMEDSERIAIKRYEHWKYNYSHDNDNNRNDMRRIEHYQEGLPECYTNPVVHLSRSELLSLGAVRFSAYSENTSTQNEDFLPTPFAAGRLLSSPVRLPMDHLVPSLGYDELMEIEEALHHIVSNTLHYSQAVWASLSDNERILMLEPYTIDLSAAVLSPLAAEDAQGERDGNSEPLLNCVNAKKLIGFYGNCMLLPFTYPESLAQRLGKTAGEVQDELYRYHTTNFRVPSTVVCVPTDGMVGEAVLGATNVSEKIDITRFWNWKDSDIDHITLDQSALNGRSLLERADTKGVDAPTVGVTPTAHIDGNNPLAGLLARQQPTFADALANTDLRALLTSTDKSASAGREAIVAANTDMVKSTISAATEVAKAAATGGLSSLGGLGDTDVIKSALGSLGLSDSEVGSVMQKLSGGKLNTSDLLQTVVNGAKKSGSGTQKPAETPKPEDTGGTEEQHPSPRGQGQEDGGGGDDPIGEDHTGEPEAPVSPESEQPENGSEQPPEGGAGESVHSGSPAAQALLERMLNAIRSDGNAVSFLNQELSSESGQTLSLDELNMLADLVCARDGCSADELLEQLSK